MACDKAEQQSVLADHDKKIDGLQSKYLKEEERKAKAKPPDLFLQELLQERDAEKKSAAAKANGVPAKTNTMTTDESKLPARNPPIMEGVETVIIEGPAAQEIEIGTTYPEHTTAAM